MGLFAVCDKKGKSEGINDPDVKEKVDELRAVDPDFEVEECIYTQKRRWFSKPDEFAKYTLFYDVKVGFGNWQVLQCASGGKEKLLAYIYGYLQATDDNRKEPQ